jgi:hypothetical protein
VVRGGKNVVPDAGGPSTTVARLEPENDGVLAVCTWFAETKKEIGSFPVIALEYAD